MIWIIDASVALKWFLADQSNPHADAVLRRVIDKPGDFAVPELFAFEVHAVLCRLHPQASRVYSQGVMPLLQGGIFRQPMSERLAKDASTYAGMGLTGYDACYAALAKDLKGVWLTFDAKAHKHIEKEHVSHNLNRGLPQKWPQ